MAVFSALKNKKNQKMREGIEDLALKCAESGEKDDNIQVLPLLDCQAKVQVWRRPGEEGQS